jgi:hypothetical protein
MKKQTQTKKRQNRSRSRSKKVTRSKKYNKKSNLIGGREVKVHPLGPPKFFTGNEFTIYDDKDEVLGEFRLYRIVMDPEEGYAEYFFRNLNNDTNVLKIHDKNLNFYDFVMTHDDTLF